MIETKLYRKTNTKSRKISEPYICTRGKERRKEGRGKGKGRKLKLGEIR